MLYLQYLTLMIISEILILSVFMIINKKNSKSSQLKKIVSLLLCSLFIWTFSLILQIIFQNCNISLTFFEGLASFGACFLPIFVLFLGIVFGKTKIKIHWYFIFLFIIPILSTILMFTNNSHHLMYEYYSIYTGETIFGKYFFIHSVYSYTCIFIGLTCLLFFSIKNSGLFSKQSLLLILGTLIPLFINICGTLGIVNLTVYVTPISFTIGILFYAFAIFKFNFLGATPIALQKIVDRISDSYIVLNDDGTITDFNQTFLTTFNIKDSKDLRGQNFETFLKENNLYLNFKKIKNALPKVKNSEKTVSFDLYIRKIEKHFHIEINSILSEGASLGTLILFKDVTQHIEDMQKIKDTQETLMEAERLSSLGQLIGGIAHNLKTPIMSIAGAAEGLTDLVKEYDSSIDDPEVNSQDHHDIAKDMNEWIVKIKEYTEYMSDIITAVKGQAVTLSETENVSFDIDELVKRVDILMKHELKNALVYLNVQMKAPKNTTIHGDVNSLVQVINNMISNSIQAYNGKPEQYIDLTLEKQKNNLIISVKDYGSGLPQKVKEKLFKEMITTKGKNGTGLGLYMSYSTIKAHFNGDITFESEENEGTTFNIILPL